MASRWFSPGCGISAINRNSVIALTLVAIAACVAFIVYAGQRIYGTIGPSRAFAVADGRLYLLSHGHIHVFGMDGHRIQAIDLRALGVHPRPSDFEVHRDGRIVMADPNESVLVRCTPPTGPCERLDIGLTKAPLQEVIPLNPAKLHIDEGAGRYYVSDNAGHRLVIADFAGHALGSSGAREVWYPNRISSRDGELTVVDTNHRRLATFDVKGDRVGTLVRAMSTAGTATIARPGRTWPFDSVTTPEGETWVMVARSGMHDGDVVIFDRNERPTKRLALEETADPFDIELWRDLVWVSDATRYTFQSWRLDGSPGPALEDAAFLAELREARETPERWKKLRRLGQLATVAIALISLLVLWRLARRRRPTT